MIRSFDPLCRWEEERRDERREETRDEMGQRGQRGRRDREVVISTAVLLCIV
jgi:hypothetical protein